MPRILRWALAAVLLFFLLSEGLPWLRQRVEGISHDKIAGRPKLMADEATFCVHFVEETNDFIARHLHTVWPPPGDPTAWLAAADEIRNRVSESARSCGCADQACALGTQALERIEALVGDLDLVVSGDSRFAGTLARQQEAINDLIDGARDLTR